MVGLLFYMSVPLGDWLYDPLYKHFTNTGGVVTNTLTLKNISVDLPTAFI